MKKEFEKQDNSQLDDFKLELFGLISKSQDDFEKLIIYLSAGAITISLPLIQFIVGNLSDASFKLMLFVGWIFLISTLILNLYSHFYTVKQHRKTIKEIRDNHYSEDNAIKRNASIDRLNLIALYLLLFGVLLVLAFIAINILTK